jgi:antitoxin (DNA-binding transcriptional repressor) of toxin-antitoxin stability system
MKRISISDLRNDFGKVGRMLAAGEVIQVTKRNKLIARICPDKDVPLDEHRPAMPDFLGRIREMFGDKVFEPSNAELIAEDRDRF